MLKSKQEIISEYQLHDADTGSSEVQISILTHRINHIIEHLKQHPQDNHSRRGLLLLVGQRKRLMKYLKKENPESLVKIAEKLKLKLKKD